MSEPTFHSFAKDPNWEVAYEKTRRSLIERLENWDDQYTWDEFYRTYWRLIYSVAMRSGLRSEEALDVVQETVLAIAKQWKQNKRYDPAAGSFKSWLMHITRWRIADQFRKRAKDTAGALPEEGNRRTAMLDRIADPADPLGRMWEEEWRGNLIRRAIGQAKLRVSPKQYQIFDCYVVKGWDAKRVVKELGVSMAQVYLAKHRIGNLIKKEIEGLEKQLI